MAGLLNRCLADSRQISTEFQWAYGLSFLMKISKGIGVVCAVLAILTLLTSCGNSKSNADTVPAQPKAIKVGISKIEPVTIKDILILPGETEARHDVTLAAERDGRVERIDPSEGQTVKKGDLILEIDVAALKAALDRAQAAYDLADHIADRRESLHKGELVAKEKLEEAVTQRTLAQGNLREAKVKYEQGFVRSPIDGVLNKLYVDPGEFVNRGNKIAELVDINTLRINVNVPEMDVRFLKVGQKARITVDAYPKKHWIGTVDLVSFKADPTTRTFKVRLVIDNADGCIRPGMISRVAFIKRLIKNAITAPLFSIIDKGGERIVFIEENGVAHARMVSIGVIEGDTVQITDGLNPGENIIVKNQHEVEEGMKVIVE